jgi:hypothetical protein
MLSERDPIMECVMRFWFPIMLLAGLAACSSDRDAARYQFGVSVDRAAATAGTSDAEVQAGLDWKASQICTGGYKIVKVDTLAAEDGRQIVDRDVQCNEYSPDLLPSDAAFSNFWPGDITWPSLF